MSLSLDNGSDTKPAATADGLQTIPSVASFHFIEQSSHSDSVSGPTGCLRESLFSGLSVLHRGIRLVE